MKASPKINEQQQQPQTDIHSNFYIDFVLKPRVERERKKKYECV